MTPLDEARRLQALHDLELLDTPREERFDRIVRVTRQALDVPAAQISLIDADRQWRKAVHGEADLDPGADQLDRSDSFCAIAVAHDATLVVPDASQDPRFAENPLVTGPAQLRFYAGEPIHAADGSPVGTLCVFGSTPHQPYPGQLEMLREFARWVELELQVRREREELGRMQRRFLHAAAHELRTPVTTLRGYVEELLDEEPEPDPDAPAAALDRASRRLADFVEDVLLSTRPEPLAAAPELEETDVAALAHTIVSSNPELDARVRVVTDGPVPARVDRRRLSVAIRALLRDALDGSRGTVLLHVRSEGPLAVVDLRPGIPPDGLGAALARAVADLHGGALESGHDASGSRTVLLLPADGGAARP